MRLRAFVEGAVGEKPSDRGRGWLDQIGPVRVRCGVPSGPGVLMTGCVASYAEEEDADSRSAWVGGALSGRRPERHGELGGVLISIPRPLGQSLYRSEAGRASFRPPFC